MRHVRLLPLLTLLAGLPLIAQTLSITMLAGSNTGGGIADGTGAAARFSAPRSVATDAAGNIYVADTGNHAIRRVTPSGTVSLVAGLPGVEGYADGIGGVARFRFPTGVAVDRVTGVIYVADKDNHAIRRVTPEGVVTTIAGAPGVAGSADAVGALAKFAFPRGLVVGPDGDIFVADQSNHAIRRVTPSGVVSTFAGGILFAGNADGPALDARFNRPSDIAYDALNNIFYVADTGNHRLRAIAPNGTVSTLAGSTAGYQDGIRSTAQFNGLWGLDVAGDGNIYVADHENNSIRRVTPEGVVTTLAGRVVNGNPSSGSEDGVGRDARFNFPSGVATSPDGQTLYIADAFNFAIRVVALPSGSVGTLAGSKPQRGFVNGGRTDARLHFPNGVAADASGNVYVAETNSIRKITPNGVTSTLAGKPGESGGLDGPAGAARFIDPSGIAIGPDGNLYVTDPGNHTIRKVTPSGFVTTVAGNAFAGPGYEDGPGPTARFSFPWGIAVSSENVIFVSELGNHTIRRIDAAGNVTTFAGNPSPGFFDAAGTTSRFHFPSGISLDGAGNLYVADFGNNVIRKVDPSGVTSTVAGGNRSAPGAADGVRRDARFTSPSGVVSDASGNLYVSEYNHVIRYITSTGVVSTVAGLVGSPGNLNGTGSDARFNHPENLALLPSGQLLIADALNHAVRLGTRVTGVRRRVARQ